MKKQFIMAAAMLTAGLGAQASTNIVSGNITNSTVWTSDNIYTMTNQVYVLPGASLKIEAGTKVMSDQGSLAVCRGAQIFILGTKDNPVIMTSTSDDLTTWRASALEWGNLTIMGNALVAATTDGNGTGQPDGTDTSPMEGLTAAYPGDPNVIYGGNNDDDDSGTIQYVSFRYGGKVLGLGNELNGLSMGGIGRGTDVNHVDIMNNVDDGIETWGGTVNYKYISIWNIGDDSFDLDQGWRGKAQFVLLVQGYSLDAKQGSGIGDNCMEMDGAEVASAQPVGTAQFYNFTVIGQPGDFNPGGDQGSEWRDGMRAQIRDSIFMDIGGDAFKNAISDGEHGVMGYGINGVPTLSNLFVTAWNDYPTNSVGVDPATLYQSFVDGNMAEIKSCVFYNTETDSLTDPTYNIMGAGNMNTIAATMPIQGIQRGATVSLYGGTLDMMPVTNLNPCAANDALTTSMVAPNDGFYTPASYKGAFSANYNWLAGWTAADAYGMTDTSMNNAVVPSASLGLGAAVSFQSDAGVSYDIEGTDDMVNGPWTVVSSVVGDGSVMKVVDTGLPSAQFYRVVITP